MTTRDEIAAWFERGRFDNATHILVLVDRFDHEDFPEEWTNVVEVYDLRLDRDTQLAERRAWHLPARTEVMGR